MPGPLCNILIGRDSTVYLIAAGKSNHAGFGGPLRGVPKDSGNQYAVGVEVENNGVGEPWSKELIKACDTVFAVTLKHLKRGAAWRHMGHKEYAPDRKIDPKGIDMNRDRERVKRLLKGL